MDCCCYFCDCFFFFYYEFHGQLSNKNEVFGQFGDYFGGILNPIIAGFAFYLIAATYDLQKTELEETRKITESFNRGTNGTNKFGCVDGTFKFEFDKSFFT